MDLVISHRAARRSSSAKAKLEAGNANSTKDAPIYHRGVARLAEKHALEDANW